MSAFSIFSILKNKSQTFLQKVSHFFSHLTKKIFSHKSSSSIHDEELVASLAPKRLPRFRQFKYLSKVLNPKEWIVFKIAFLIFVISLVGFLTKGFFQVTDIVPAKGGSYTEGLVGLPKLINPLYSTLNDIDQDLDSLIFAGLVKIDKHQQIVPDMAEGWIVSEDQTEYTFTLRDDLKWHDGKPVLAEDVLFTIEAIQDPDFKSPLASSFTNVDIQIIDDKTIKFILPESYSLFLENLTVGILPSHIWREVVPANALLADYNLRPIGSGPYKFKSLTKDKLGNIKLYTIERNDDYLPKPSYIEEINFKFYPDFTTAATALRGHNIDGVSYLSKELQEEVSVRKDLNYNLLGLPQYTAVFFNQTNNPILEDLGVRKALAHALDKNEIVTEALGGEGQVIEAPILPGFIGYNPNISLYETNLDKANELLESAGWKFLVSDEETTSTEIMSAGTLQIRYKDDKPFKITLTTVNRSENFKTAQLIQRMWQAIGVQTEIKLVEATEIQANVIRKRNFEALLFGEIFGTDPDPYPFWHSSQAGENGLNLPNFINKEADQVLEEARQTSDPQARNDKYIHFQNILNQYLPAIFLYTPKYLYPVSNQIKGIEVQVISSPSDRFADIEEWYIKTRHSFK